MRLTTIIFFTVALALGQAQSPPAFEVASVRPAVHGRDAAGWSRSSIGDNHGRLVAENSSLDEMIRYAYTLKDYQVLGPAWLNDDSECFDVAAKAPPDATSNATSKEIRTMMQTLLAQRFKLAAHREERTLPIYNLVVAKSGFRLTPVSPTGHGGTSSGGGTMKATSLSMAEFAYQLSRELKLPVFDKTGIEGAFDFTLQYAPERDTSATGPSLFTAIQETLGLKLESAKGPVEVLIVDHIEKAPTEN
jgi:uncharacterized protein (TIGR03435 family)